MNSKVTERFIKCYEGLRNQNMVRSARQFALALDFHPQSWNEILKGRREVTLNLVERAVQTFAFNPMFLYTGDGPLVRDENLNGNLKILTVVTDHVGRENIVHIPTKAQAGYTAEAAPLEVVRSLMNYSVPGMEHRFGTFRSFEVEGDSMTPTVDPGEIVICRYIQPDYWEKQIQDDQVYVVVSREDLVIKRVKNRIEDHGALHLHSDNPEFETYLMPQEKVHEIWHVEKVIRSFDQKTPAQEPKTSTADLLELVRLQSGLIQEMQSQQSSTS
jgi:phage repressor protein C with HTH and peptisase S24 domain